MKNIYLLITGLILIVAFHACKDEKCPECFTPPEPIRMQVLDKNAENDLIYTNVFNKDSISLFYFENNIKILVEMDVIVDSLTSSVFIYSPEMPWLCISDPKTFILYLSHNDLDTIYMDVLAKSDDCCAWHPVNEFTLNEENLQLNIENYSYTIWK